MGFGINNQPIRLSDDWRLLATAQEAVSAAIAEGYFGARTRRNFSGHEWCFRSLLEPVLPSMDEPAISGLLVFYPYQNGQLWVDSIYVWPAYRRSGIATALLNAVFDHVRKEPMTYEKDVGGKVDRVNLATLTFNEEARALYKKFGFIEEAIFLTRPVGD